MPSAAQRKLLSKMVALTICSMGLIAASSKSEAAGKFPWDAPDVVVQTKCPALAAKQYAPATLSKMATELRALRKLDPKAVTPEVVNEYKSLRAQCAAYGSPEAGAEPR